MEWTLRIENWIPVSVNKLLSVHWGKRSKIKNESYTLIAVAARNAQVPHASRKRSVHVHIVYQKKARRLDHDNMKKILLDALVAAKVLMNDSPEWLSGVIFTDSRSELEHPITYITIQEN